MLIYGRQNRCVFVVSMSTLNVRIRFENEYMVLVDIQINRQILCPLRRTN